MTENLNPTAGPTYPKIPSPYEREVSGPNRNKLIEGQWSSRELELTAGLTDWQFTEKLDGTNTRIRWDGYSVSFAGRTNNAQIQPEVLEYLEDTFREELFEQQFGEKQVTIYAEAVGPKIQKVGRFYGETKVRVFDAKIGDLWMSYENIGNIAAALGVGTVPLVIQGVSLFTGIEIVRGGLLSDESVEPLTAEGLVGTLASGMLTRRGSRIQTKIKAVDFK